VKDTAVVARQDSRGESRLVGYVTARGEDPPTIESLRNHLQEVVPEHMVPNALMVLDHMPLSPNGKLDRRALPPPELSASAARDYKAPEGDIEHQVAAIWQDLLLVERPGRNDDFFDLGGHSLLAMQACARMHGALGIEVPVATLFERPTLREFSARVADLYSSALLDRVTAGGTETEELLAMIAALPHGRVHELLCKLRTERK
jgi:hypothetical protein